MPSATHARIQVLLAANPVAGALNPFATPAATMHEERADPSSAAWAIPASERRAWGQGARIAAMPPSESISLPDRPPFVLRARVLT
ncbi:MAG: hypothetical protein ACRDGI_06945, partial [Candidatus Limnocylindrales bacterium]